jgi:hypothetical protein
MVKYEEKKVNEFEGFFVYIARHNTNDVKLRQKNISEYLLLVSIINNTNLKKNFSLEFKPSHYNLTTSTFDLQLFYL